jgi:hypothetical protein
VRVRKSVAALAVRIALAIVAVLLMAWSVVLFRDERIGREAEGRVLHEPRMSQSEWARSLAQLRQAELLNPGTEWDTLRAAALVLRDKRAALRVADSVVSREPENLNAWIVVLNATRGRDARRSAQAVAQIRHLSPPVQDP